jgi:hypothetical protein
MTLPWNMPLLTQLQNVWGCGSTKISPLTGLVGRLAALPHAAAAGVIFSRQKF